MVPDLITSVKCLFDKARQTDVNHNQHMNGDEDDVTLLISLDSRLGK